MKRFKHKPTKIEVCDLILKDNKHFYNTGNIVYPSITSILSMRSKPGIDAWRYKVGNEEADRIMKGSQKVGTAFHSINEAYLKNDEIIGRYGDDFEFEPLELFASVQDELNRIDNIRAQEVPLWSDEMEVAGTVDCVAEFDGVLSIIDFKNSRKKKTRSMCKNYFMQATAYAKMWEERTGEKIEQIVIIVASWDGKNTTFVEKTEDWEDMLWDLLIEYDEFIMAKSVKQL
jgi:genome maintenance exonuclease 1